MIRIEKISCNQVFEAENYESLSKEYAEACADPDYCPQIEMYRAMEKAGALFAFGAYLKDELIGFISTVCALMPHNGKKVGSIESFFVARKHRGTGAGLMLLAANRRHAKQIGCQKVLYTARLESELETILLRTKSVQATHMGFTEWLS